MKLLFADDACDISDAIEKVLVSEIFMKILLKEVSLRHLCHFLLTFPSLTENSATTQRF